MKQITQKEFIKILEEKQEKANHSLYGVSVEEGIKNLAYIEAYKEIICLLKNREIVPERNDELDARQYAFTGLLENQDLALLYFGEKVTVYTREKIVGSRTPFKSIGEIVRDNGKDIEIQEEDGGHVIIEKKNIKNIVPKTKREEKTCECYDPIYKRCNGTRERDECYCNGDQNKCTHYPKKRIVTTIPNLTQEDLKKFIPIRPTDKEKQKEFEEQVIMKPFIDELKNIDPKEIPITPYNEPKVEPLRNDRFREFVDGETTLTIDAKAISSIKVNKIDLNIQINENGNYGFEKFFKSEDEATAYYNDLLAWVKYWKRN